MSEEPDSPADLTPDAAAAVARVLPDVPPPFGLHSTANQRIGALNERRMQLGKDLARLRRHALKAPTRGAPADDEDGMTIAHPVLFAAALDRQMRLLDLDLKVHQEVYDVDRVREYLHRLSTTVIARILDADPDLGAALLDDVKALNAEFNIGGDPAKS
jgi:chorismate mutase